MAHLYRYPLIVIGQDPLSDADAGYCVAAYNSSTVVASPLCRAGCRAPIAVVQGSFARNMSFEEASRLSHMTAAVAGMRGPSSRAMRGERLGVNKTKTLRVAASRSVHADLSTQSRVTIAANTSRS